jgi:phosphosulfolactate synthase (CoM biosynthesis protein A)
MNENTDEIYEKVMNSGILEQGIKIGIEKGREIGREEGIEKGIKEGRFNLAIELKNTLGIDKAIELSGFTRKELENETLTTE